MKKISDILRKKQVLYPLIAFAGFILGGFCSVLPLHRELPKGYCLNLLFTTLTDHPMTLYRTNPVSGPVPCILRFVRINRVNVLSAVWI